MPVVQNEDDDEASVDPSTPIKREIDPAMLEEVSRTLFKDDQNLTA